MATSGPYLIVGMPRSGTTFLTRQLTCHPEIAAFGESRFWGNDWVEPGPAGYDERQLATVLARLAANPLDTNVRIDGSTPAPPGWLQAISRDDLPGLVDQVAAVLQPPVEPGSVFVEWLRTIATGEGKTIAVEKTPHHVRHLDRIRRYLPDARFIVLIRDPVEFLLSYKFAADARVPAFRSRSRRRWNPIGTSLMWRSYLRHSLRAVEALGPEALLVRNENLRADPDGTTARVLEFIGVDPMTDGPLAGDRPPTNTSFRRARAQLKPGELAWLDRLARADAVAAGYTVPDRDASIPDRALVALSVVPWAVRNAIDLSRQLDEPLLRYARRAFRQ